MIETIISWFVSTAVSNPTATSMAIMACNLLNWSNYFGTYVYYLKYYWYQLTY